MVREGRTSSIEINGKRFAKVSPRFSRCWLRKVSFRIAPQVRPAAGEVRFLPREGGERLWPEHTRQTTCGRG